MTALEQMSLEVTPTFVVSTALATRDWTEVHHDRDYAQARGSKDIFVNILTSQALVQRYVEDTLGHDVEIAAIDVRLGAPAYPGDTMVFTGDRDGDTVSVTATVPLGAHIDARVALVEEVAQRPSRDPVTDAPTASSGDLVTGAGAPSSTTGGPR